VIADLSKPVYTTQHVTINMPGQANSPFEVRLVSTPVFINDTAEAANITIYITASTSGQIQTLNGMWQFSNAYPYHEIALFFDNGQITIYYTQVEAPYISGNVIDVIHNNELPLFILICLGVFIIAYLLRKRSSLPIVTDGKKKSQKKSVATVVPDQAREHERNESRSALIYTAIIFTITRVALTISGIIAYYVYDHQFSPFSPTELLNIWTGLADASLSGAYANIAHNGYISSALEPALYNFRYWPMFPTLIRIVGTLLGNYQVSALIVSNIFMFVACYFIYMIVRLDSDGSTARRAIKYMVLFPSAILFSTGQSESLCLALMLASYYYMKKHEWPMAGVLGGMAALTRPYAMFMIIPFMYEYMKTKNFKPGHIDPKILFGLLILLLPCIFLGYSYLRTGDPLVFTHVEEVLSGPPQDPLINLLYDLITLYPGPLFNGLVITACLALLLLFSNKIDPALLSYGLLVILIPLTGMMDMDSLTRYAFLCFPLFIILAKITRDKRVDVPLTVLLAILQLVLMATWVMGGVFLV
jgi:hypothetical protein